MDKPSKTSDWSVCAHLEQGPWTVVVRGPKLSVLTNATEVSELNDGAGGDLRRRGPHGTGFVQSEGEILIPAENKLAASDMSIDIGNYMGSNSVPDQVTRCDDFSNMLLDASNPFSASSCWTHTRFSLEFWYRTWISGTVLQSILPLSLPLPVSPTLGLIFFLTNSPLGRAAFSLTFSRG